MALRKVVRPYHLAPNYNPSRHLLLCSPFHKYAAATERSTVADVRNCPVTVLPLFAAFWRPFYCVGVAPASARPVVLRSSAVVVAAAAVFRYSVKGCGCNGGEGRLREGLMGLFGCFIKSAVELCS